MRVSFLVLYTVSYTQITLNKAAKESLEKKVKSVALTFKMTKDILTQGSLAYSLREKAE